MAQKNVFYCDMKDCTERAETDVSAAGLPHKWVRVNIEDDREHYRYGTKTGGKLACCLEHALAMATDCHHADVKVISVKWGSKPASSED